MCITSSMMCKLSRQSCNKHKPSQSLTYLILYKREVRVSTAPRQQEECAIACQSYAWRNTMEWIGVRLASSIHTDTPTFSNAVRIGEATEEKRKRKENPLRFLCASRTTRVSASTVSRNLKRDKMQFASRVTTVHRQCP